MTFKSCEGDVRTLTHTFRVLLLLLFPVASRVWIIGDSIITWAGQQRDQLGGAGVVTWKGWGVQSWLDFCPDLMVIRRDNPHQMFLLSTSELTFFLMSLPRFEVGFRGAFRGPTGCFPTPELSGWTYCHVSTTMVSTIRGRGGVRDG